MTQADILAELPKLKPEERQEILERLWELQDQEPIAGAGPSDELKKLLDQELEEFERDGGAGQPWPEVLAELRARSPR